MMSLVWSFFLEEQPVLVSQKLRNVSLERKKKNTPGFPLCLLWPSSPGGEHVAFPAMMMRSVSVFIPLG